ncbi:unnamed protein product [Orchesella dallaii]|uniref:Uncharacterized protein n=1 Tax=Orchesella dallaii TaxID=48710 RepID=A0ABP1Q4U4_9HEXA
MLTYIFCIHSTSTFSTLKYNCFFCHFRFFVCNAGILYLYFSGFQKVDEEEFGGAWELTKEGFMTSFAGFLVTWIVVYSGLHFSEHDFQPFVAS